MATVSKSKLALRFDIKIPPQNIYYPSIGYFVANATNKKKGIVFGSRVKELLPRQHSQDLLARNLLELTTSLPDAFSIQSGEIVSFPQVLCWLALYFILNFF
ncbi:hypothetical protein HMPREF0549_1286 [Limosilactobacillus vaginalis DSM 5837 = ATCC 49540]|uniref:Uncharacterized protein n=1 Tax=Limosilactobacillus vaginalis DSM 5837 = ATCC 49540 TaxID=1423814 RepID=C2EV00_9LACO|nr:hypothetical protein HMPREF0549_1286 [Limosilactobacillus vaginalis DSM 5837 = ATCC 49540]